MSTAAAATGDKRPIRNVWALVAGQEKRSRKEHDTRRETCVEIVGTWNAQLRLHSCLLRGISGFTPIQIAPDAAVGARLCSDAALPCVLASQDGLACKGFLSIYTSTTPSRAGFRLRALHASGSRGRKYETRRRQGTATLRYHARHAEMRSSRCNQESRVQTTSWASQFASLHEPSLMASVAHLLRWEPPLDPFLATSLSLAFSAR